MSVKPGISTHQPSLMIASQKNAYLSQIENELRSRQASIIRLKGKPLNTCNTLNYPVSPTGKYKALEPLAKKKFITNRNIVKSIDNGLESPMQ